MEDFFDAFTAPQREAQSILRHLLKKLRDPTSQHYVRYARWVERHPKLEEFCFRCIRPNVWRFLDGKWNLDGLKVIGGDTKSSSAGIYFNGILGLDKHTRIYVGQSVNLRLRIAQHWNFRYRRDNPSLHYHALQQSIYNVFGILAALPSPSMGNHALPGMDHPDLLLNVLEMWMCLIFRCLPDVTLEEWLPEGVERKGRFGMLNIATPLDNGESRRGWVDLSESKDPLVQEYPNKDKRVQEIEAVEKKVEKDEMYLDRKGNEKQQLVVQIPAQTIVLVGAAFLVGWLLNRPTLGGRLR